MAARRKTKKATPASSHKTISPLFLLGILMIIGILGTSIYLIAADNSHKTTYLSDPTTHQSDVFDFGNEMIMLNNEELQFTNGTYSTNDPVTGKHSATILNRTVNPAVNRAAAILIDNPGGSGTFYYLVGSMLIDGKEVYSTPVLLGDRIKVVSVSVDNPGTEDNGQIIVEYLDRPTGAPLSSDPNQPMSATYAFEENGNLIEVLPEE